jgi:hypothetical protein
MVAQVSGEPFADGYGRADISVLSITLVYVAHLNLIVGLRRLLIAVS